MSKTIKLGNKMVEMGFNEEPEEMRSYHYIVDVENISKFEQLLIDNNIRDYKNAGLIDRGNGIKREYHVNGTEEQLDELREYM